MAETDRVFAGGIPEIYERFLVPLIFAEYADDLARRTVAIGPRDVLETAAGTGVVTRALAAVLPPATRIVATDLNQPMLDVGVTQRPSDGRIVTQQADAQHLPFVDASFDVVVCQFGAMFFPDKVRAYAEARRVLRPGGCFLFSVWDRIAANEFADVVTRALAELLGPSAPDFLARTPHGYHDVQGIEAELRAAGFAAVAVETVERMSRAPAARDVAVAYCHGTPVRNEIDTRFAGRLEEATQFAAAAVAQQFGHGPVEGRIRAHVFKAARG